MTHPEIRTHPPDYETPCNGGRNRSPVRVALETAADASPGLWVSIEYPSAAGYALGDSIRKRGEYEARYRDGRLYVRAPSDARRAAAGDAA